MGWDIGRISLENVDWVKMANELSDRGYSEWECQLNPNNPHHVEDARLYVTHYIRHLRKL